MCSEWRHRIRYYPRPPLLCNCHAKLVQLMVMSDIYMADTRVSISSKLMVSFKESNLLGNRNLFLVMTFSWGQVKKSDWRQHGHEWQLNMRKSHAYYDGLIVTLLYFWLLLLLLGYDDGELLCRPHFSWTKRSDRKSFMRAYIVELNRIIFGSMPTFQDVQPIVTNRAVLMMNSVVVIILAMLVHSIPMHSMMKRRRENRN